MDKQLQHSTAYAGNDSVNGLRRARNLISSIIIILHLMTILSRSQVELVIKWWQKAYRWTKRYLSQMGWILVIYTALALWWREIIRIEDVLDLGEKFNDVLFVSRNNANLVERSTVNTNDILVLGEKINDSLVVSEWGVF